MMKTVILICALGMARGDCGVDNAVTVIQGPDAQHAGICGLHGQAYLAETPLADYLDGEHYLKITCTSADRQPLAARRPDSAKTLAEAQRFER